MSYWQRTGDGKIPNKEMHVIAESRPQNHCKTQLPNS